MTCPLPTPNFTTMEIIYNKDKSVTINATESEYGAICEGIAQKCIQTSNFPTHGFYKSIMDAMNKAYNEQVLNGGL